MKQYCNSQILGGNVLHVRYIHTPLIYQQEVEMSACFNFFRKTIHQKLHELYLETCQNQDDSKVCL